MDDSKLATKSIGADQQRRQDPVTVYARLRQPVGSAVILRDDLGRDHLCIQLTSLPLDGTICLPLADLLVTVEDARSAGPPEVIPTSERVGHA